MSVKENKKKILVWKTGDRLKGLKLQRFGKQKFTYNGKLQRSSLSPFYTVPKNRHKRNEEKMNNDCSYPQLIYNCWKYFIELDNIKYG